MRVRSHPEVASAHEAYALLGLTGPADRETLTAAFRSAVKAARPDTPDGDDERFRKVIAAWRLVQRQAPSAPAAPPAALAPAAPVITISPLDAVRGGAAEVRLNDGRRLRVRIPAGLRSGEFLRLKAKGGTGADLRLPVLIRGGDDLGVIGDDLYMTCPVPPRLLEDGGRLEIETHAGTRSAWLVAGHQPLRLRLRDLGLPARGRRPRGHLFVTLRPSGDARSAAEDLLLRFSRVWTSDRLAA